MNGNLFDRTLKCITCGKDFHFSVGEQQYYADKHFVDPKRCRECRGEKKRKQNAEEAARKNGLHS